MKLGSIQVLVYTSRAKIPVPNATILMMETKENQKDTIFAIEVTNTSGYTTTVQIPTPEEESSTSPSPQSPATLLDIWIEHPDFIAQKIEGVQLFPDTETILPVELLPLIEHQSSLVEETIVDLPTQDL